MAFARTVSIHLPASDIDEQRPDIRIGFWETGDDGLVTIAGEFTFKLPVRFRESPIPDVERAAFDHIRDRLPDLVSALPAARP